MTEIKYEDNKQKITAKENREKKHQTKEMKLIASSKMLLLERLKLI